MHSGFSDSMLAEDKYYNESEVKFIADKHIEALRETIKTQQVKKS